VGQAVTELNRLARDADRLKYSDAQPRDDHGRWAGGNGAVPSEQYHNAARDYATRTGGLVAAHGLYRANMGRTHPALGQPGRGKAILHMHPSAVDLPAYAVVAQGHTETQWTRQASSPSWISSGYREVGGFTPTGIRTISPGEPGYDHLEEADHALRGAISDVATERHLQRTYKAEDGSAVDLLNSIEYEADR
jgi:hypothetical protein